MDDLPINDTITIPGWELWFTASRASGAGGQHVNKTNSRVTLYWALGRSTALDEAARARVARRLGSHLDQEGVVQISVEDERSQHRNREIARERLAELVRAALVRPKRRVATQPSRASQRRRVEDKRQRSRTKELRKNPDA